MRPRGNARAGVCALALALLATAACDSSSEPSADGSPEPSQSSSVAPTDATSSPSPPLAQRGPFTFASAGDHGANEITELSLTALDASEADFYIALGDLDYDETESDEAWCGYVKERLPSKGREFPFELVVGNHENGDEDPGDDDGEIADFAACLPDRMSSRIGPGSSYGVEYAFDYPTEVPLARFIMISPGLTVGDEEYTYEPGTSHRDWLADEIDQAREAGIRWVIVAAHQPCLNTGIRHGCDSGAAVMNLLVEKRVDLMLAGHNHLYERSVQLGLDEESCPEVVPDSFDEGCVVDDGSDGGYDAGRGSVMVTAGSFGRLEDAEDLDDDEADYFVTSDPATTGFVQVTVSSQSLLGELVATTGDLEDSFEIIAR